MRRNHELMAVGPIVPFSLFWAWRSGDGSDASVLHKCYARGVWSQRRVRERAALFARILVWWPISTLGLIAACTVVNGVETRRRFGKPIWRQVAEQISVAVRHSVPPPWYYLFCLWDDARRQQAHLYLHRYETKGAIYRLLREELGGSSWVLGSKLVFDERCRKAELAVPPIAMVLQNGVVTRGDRPLPEVDLFVKPVKARGGTGAERWRCVGSGRYRNDAGEECAEPELVARLAERSREKPMLVQHRLLNHPELADLTAGALATARLMTVLNEHGKHEVALAVFRTGLDPHCPVDNYHAGGLVAPVDLTTGELGEASGGGSLNVPRVARMIRYDAHPVTGGRIKGRRLPLWREAMALAVRAHAAFPGLAVVGWDIGLTPDGAVLVEGNSSPDVDLMQVGHQAPMGNTRVAAALAQLVHQASSGSLRPANRGGNRKLDSGGRET
jgi:hypothetical protein